MIASTTSAGESCWAQLLADEQAELGRSIHDEVGPSLAAMRIAIATARHGNVDEALSLLSANVGALEEWVAVRRTRMHASLVRRVGLGDALAWHSADREQANHGSLTVRDEGFERALPFEVALAAFGFAQEQLACWAASARSAATIVLAFEEHTLRLELSVERPEKREVGALRFPQIVAALSGTIETCELEGLYRAVLRMGVAD